MNQELLKETEAEDEGVIRAVAGGALPNGIYAYIEDSTKTAGQPNVKKFNVLRSICRAIVRMQDG